MKACIVKSEIQFPGTREHRCWLGFHFITPYFRGQHSVSVLDTDTDSEEMNELISDALVYIREHG